MSFFVYVQIIQVDDIEENIYLCIWKWDEWLILLECPNLADMIKALLGIAIMGMVVLDITGIQIIF